MPKHARRLKLYSTAIVTIIFVLLIAGTFLFRYSYLSGQTAWQVIEYARVKIDMCCTDNPFAFLYGQADQSSNGSAGSIPVLAYHGIITEPDGINITKDAFRDQMIALKRAGYTTITTEDLYEFMRGEKILPQQSILITFDDGRSDSVYHADPIFKALDFNAVMFAISKHSVDRVQDASFTSSHYLSRSQLERMSAGNRWEVQAHTHDGHDPVVITAGEETGHYYSNLLWLEEEERIETEKEYAERTRRDLETLKNKIEEVLEEEVHSIAFPFGDFGQETKNFPGAEDIMLQHFRDLYKMGFYQYYPGHRFTQNYSREHTRDNENFLIQRIKVDSEWSGEELASFLEQGRHKPLPFESDFTNTGPWISTWSDYESQPNGIMLAPVSGETGAAVVLDGSGGWRNYEISAVAGTAVENSITIWSRYQNDQNSVGCNFSNEFVHIEQTLRGEISVIRGFRENYGYNGGRMELGMRVNGRTVECLFNGRVIVRSDFLDNDLAEGGIGFKVWNPDPSSASATLRSVEVTKI